MGFAHDRRAAQSYSLGETMRSIHRLLTVVLVLVGTLTSTGAYGQGGATGAISGAVVDTSGGGGGGGGSPKFFIRRGGGGRQGLIKTDGAGGVSPAAPAILRPG